MQDPAGHRNARRASYLTQLSYRPQLVLNCFILLALLMHVAVFLAVANRTKSRWSGGGDAPIYQDLAENLSEGRGYTFAGTPTAFRAPVYSLSLAALMRVSPSDWRLFLRAIQLCCAIGTAALCGSLAKLWGGDWKLGFLFALSMPTLLFFQTEILTESLAALLITAWWFWLLRSFGNSGMLGGTLVGVCAGIVSLERFNAIPLVIIAPLCLFRLKFHRRALLTLAAGCVVLTPWLAHNWRVLGEPLYSTHSGFALVEGVLSPTGRGDPAEIAAMRSKLGWYNGDVESNSAPPSLRDELALDAQARREGWTLWSQLSIRQALHLLAIKFGAFWLSTDQVVATGAFSPKVRLLRWAGVAVYLVCLGLAILGWSRLYRREPGIAWLIVGFALFITVLHLPLTMNTRLRVPFFDPLITALAAVGSNHFGNQIRNPKAPSAS